jgi:N6-adenosine-specific RNA methylase IME4
MTLQQILDLPVPTIAADDCVLFLWATVPMLPEALQVMSAWGFTYKSHQIWNKDALGTGYWFRNKHELLLVGVKGQIPAPLPGTQMASVIDAPLKDHSRKPIIFRGMIEGLFPNLPKLELFARTPAPGWGQWGKEAPPVPIDEDVDGEAVTPRSRDDALMDAHREDDNDGVRNAPEGGFPVAAASPPVIDHDDGLDIPAFLRRKG